MINDLELAILTSTYAHRGQVDKGGNSYIFHPLRVMLSMDTEEEQIVAILHDVVEDTDYTLQDLQARGFSERVIQAIDSVTRREGEVYKDFIKRASQDSIGRKVKRADIIDNMDLSRIPNPSKRDLSRLKRYEKALEILGAEDYEH